MALFRSIGAALDDDGTGTEPIDVRKGLAGLLSGPGVLPGAASPLVEGTDGFEYQVNAAHWVTSRGGSDGLHLWGNDGPITVPTDVAPGAGLSRIDIIYALHPSNGENADTTSEPLIGVAKGTAAAVPIAPTIPTGALELARNTMTSAATDTAGSGNTIAQTAAQATLLADHTTPVNLALASGWSTAGGSDGAWWVKRGGFVWLGVTASRSSDASGVVNLATLPVEARPPFAVSDGGVTNAGGGAPLQVLVGASGLVQVVSSGDLNSGRKVRFTMSWPAA